MLRAHAWLLTSAASKGQTLPIALRNRVGKGTVITVLLEDAAALKELGVLQHLMGRLTADVLPFQVTLH